MNKQQQQEGSKEVVFYFDTKIRGKAWQSANSYKNIDVHVLVRASTKQEAETIAKDSVTDWFMKGNYGGKLGDVRAIALKTSFVTVLSKDMSDGK